jgi:hypothetical protein
VILGVSEQPRGDDFIAIGQLLLSAARDDRLGTAQPAVSPSSSIGRATFAKGDRAAVLILHTWT